MSGMDMGVETELGSFASFVRFWRAMMLPGAAVAVFRSARVRGVPLFVGAYLAVWTFVGVAAYTVYRPHGSLVAGALTVAAGLYELPPLKQECRRRRRDRVQSGLAFGAYCAARALG